MPLARIITRFDTCADELALHLLRRGYAVEIVSPYSIPDNFADLELRVDGHSEDQLVASVEAHEGGRSSSFQFVHRLKTPTEGSLPKPEPHIAIPFPEEPVSANGGPGIADAETPLLAQQTMTQQTRAQQNMAEAVSPVTEILLDADRDAAEGPSLFRSDEPPGSLPVEAASFETASLETTPLESIEPSLSDLRTSTIPLPVAGRERVLPNWTSQLLHRPARFYGGAALTFAGVVLLALFLGFGIHRASKVSAQGPTSVPAEKVAAPSIGVNTLGAVDSNKAPENGATKPSPANPIDNSVRVVEELPPAKTTTTTATKTKPDNLAAGTSNHGSRAALSHKHADDVVAPDTVTYLDERYKPTIQAKRAKRSPHRTSTQKRSGGMIAANSVTYLNNAPPAKPAK